MSDIESTDYNHCNKVQGTLHLFFHHSDTLHTNPNHKYKALLLPVYVLVLFSFLLTDEYLFQMVL